MNPDGYFSDQENTNYDVGFGECRPATNPNPDFKTGVVTPDASFLAMMYERGQATANLAGSRSGSTPTEPAASSTRWRSTARSPGATSRSTRQWSWGPGQRPRERRLATGVQHPGRRGGPAAGHRHRGVQRRHRGRVGPPPGMTAAADWARRQPSCHACGGAAGTESRRVGDTTWNPEAGETPDGHRGRPALGAHVDRWPAGGHRGRRCAGLPRHRPDRAGPARGIGLRPRTAAAVASRPRDRAALAHARGRVRLRPPGSTTVTSSSRGQADAGLGWRVTLRLDPARTAWSWHVEVHNDGPARVTWTSCTHTTSRSRRPGCCAPTSCT